MKSKIFYVLITATLAFTSVSCRSTRTELSDKPWHWPDLKPSKPVESPFKEAYTEKRWVGLLAKGIDQCPKVDGWVSTTLLDEMVSRAGTYEIPRDSDERPYVGARPAHRIQPHKLGLERYCVYTPEQGSSVSFQQPSGLVEASKDRLALSTTSAGGVPTDALSQKIWPALAQHFRDQTGQEISGQTSSLLLQGKPSVRLTFIDSQPDGEGSFPKPLAMDSQHGFTLVRLAQDMLCPSSGPCAVTIATRRAFRYQDFDPQAPLPPDPIAKGRSGHVGLVSDLATAIYAEILYWRQHEPDKKLILNLSLGWDGEGFRDLDARGVSQLEPSVRAVYDALRFARKSGALVIAAAGNQRGGDDTRWPLLPAAWELRRPNLFRWSFFRKPVYAVGGVDWQGLPLPNSRQGGRSRRVAYADHSVTFAEAPDDPTAIYTGTSVSAAVASSIAAAVWHLRPDLRPAQVMRLMVRSGDELPARADFYTWKRPGLLAKMVDAPHTRRLSLCPAVARACGPDGSRCPSLASAPACASWVAKPPKVAPTIQKLLPGGVALPKGFLAENPLKGLCDAASQRWVIPQPANDPCPGCTLVQKPPPDSSTTGSGTDSATASLDSSTTSSTDQLYELVIAVGSIWGNANSDSKIEGATLQIVRSDPDSTVTDTMNYTFTLPSLGVNDIYTLTDLGDGQSFQNCVAQITFLVKKPDGTMISVLNPVVVEP